MPVKCRGFLGATQSQKRQGAILLARCGRTGPPVVASSTQRVKSTRGEWGTSLRNHGSSSPLLLLKVGMPFQPGTAPCSGLPEERAFLCLPKARQGR